MMRLSRVSALAPLAGTLLALGAGCSPNVGTRSANCNDALARTVVYRLDGTPAYIGQAMLLESCAGGGNFCHAGTAMDRYGAPFQLDFDALLATDAGASLERLARTQATIHRHRNDIWATILGGSMPPGAIGDALDVELYYYIPDPSVEPISLDSIDSAEGRELLRNWLACGSPVVERTAPLASPPRCATNADCTVTHLCDVGVRECVGVGDVEPALDLEIEPTWPAIHARVIQPSCASAIGCHGPEPRSAALDLSSEAAGYAALVGVAASTDITTGAVCGGMGRTRVVPGDPDGSLLVEKLEGAPACGSAMPFGSPLSATAMTAIRDWIAAGAAP